MSYTYEVETECWRNAAVRRSVDPVDSTRRINQYQR